MYILITCNYIYIYKQIALYCVKEKANLHMDVENLILMNIYLMLLISNCFVFFRKRNQLTKENYVNNANTNIPWTWFHNF